jgi:hypothetical protein
MGFLRSVDSSNDSYIVVFISLAVEKSLPARKKLFWRELATGLRLPTYSYIGLSSLGYPQEGGVGRDENPYVGIPIPEGRNPIGTHL